MNEITPEELLDLTLDEIDEIEWNCTNTLANIMDFKKELASKPIRAWKF